MTDDGAVTDGRTVTDDDPARDAVTLDELVTAATVGVTRRPLPVTGDPAAALLDAAAMHTVARRAGFQPLRGITVPDAPADTAPAFSARAARALRQACDWTAAQGFPAGSLALPDLLAAAAHAGYIAHPPLLPALLGAAARRTAIRPQVAAVLGARGRWLASHRPDWRQAAEDGQAPAGQAPVGDNAAAWRTGGLADRLAYLTRLRDADPDAARELLAAGWARETGADRGQLIAVLARGLSLTDEEFLEAALEDRHGTVRAAARRLLGRLPGSAFSQRAARRVFLEEIGCA